jgi:hypothetical protein
MQVAVSLTFKKKHETTENSYDYIWMKNKLKKPLSNGF